MLSRTVLRMPVHLEARREEVPRLACRPQPQAGLEMQQSCYDEGFRENEVSRSGIWFLDLADSVF